MDALCDSLKYETVRDIVCFEVLSSSKGIESAEKEVFEQDLDSSCFRRTSGFSKRNAVRGPEDKHEEMGNQGMVTRRCSLIGCATM